MYWWNSESVELGENMKNLFSALCDDIKSERKRIGGHWVVTDAKLIKKSVRDFIRCCPNFILTLPCTSYHRPNDFHITKRHWRKWATFFLGLFLFSSF